MKLAFKHNVPFVSATIAYHGATLLVSDILVDTGSATTMFSTDIVRPIHIVPERTDTLHTIRGVGGVDVVFMRTVDYIQVGTFRMMTVQIDIGGMDYGFDINGILGTDFLTQAGAILDLQHMTIRFSATDR